MKKILFSPTKKELEKLILLAESEIKEWTDFLEECKEKQNETTT